VIKLPVIEKKPPIRETATPADIPLRLDRLRKLMKIHSIDAYIVTGTDTHQSEYASPCRRDREFISGFDGSFGIVVITDKSAYLWTDGRYHIQAEAQVSGGFEVFKTGLHGVQEVWQWLGDLPEKSLIAFDGRTLSVELFKKIRKHTLINSALFRYDLDLISEIWDARPTQTYSEIYLHSHLFAGETHAEKLIRVRREMGKAGVSAYLLTSLDDIAWLYNLRGSDLEFTPVAYAYAFIGMEDEHLFIKRESATFELEENLCSYGVNLRDYDDILPFITKYKPISRILINPERVSVLLRERLAAGGHFLTESQDITAELKNVKTQTELANIEQCLIRDGAAVTKFIIWLKTHIGNIDLYEHEVHDILFSYREKLPHYVCPAFSTIAAYMANAAKMHYNPSSGGMKIEPNGILLLDSGAQYKNGTTDITRTIVLGEISHEIKRDFTLVLKSHIGLATAKWLYGATGANLDILARKPMWDLGLDYKCGTGHGVGYFLNVHEGPARFSMTRASAVLEAGMVITNEPGIYREGKWGIRTENIIVAADDYENEHGRFMKFKTISYCPIDADGILTEMLNQQEKDWLNNYNAQVYEKLSPYLEPFEREYLERTKPV